MYVMAVTLLPLIMLCVPGADNHRHRVLTEMTPNMSQDGDMRCPTLMPLPFLLLICVLGVAGWRDTGHSMRALYVSQGKGEESLKDLTSKQHALPGTLTFLSDHVGQDMGEESLGHLTNKQQPPSHSLTSLSFHIGQGKGEVLGDRTSRQHPQHKLTTYSTAMISRRNEVYSTAWGQGEPYSDHHHRFRQKRSHGSENSTGAPSSSSLPSASLHEYPAFSWRLNLCDHPPPTFSEKFHGHDLGEDCIESLIVAGFNDTLKFCFGLYAQIFPEIVGTEIVLYRGDKTFSFLRLSSSESYRRICLPLLRLYDFCEESKFVDICWYERVVFINPITCPYFKRSEGAIISNLLHSILTEDYESLAMLCDGTCRVENKVVAGVSVRLSSSDLIVDGKRCGPIFVPPFEHGLNFTGQEFENTLWPSCYPFYTVVWLDDPSAYGLNPYWSFLTPSCKTVEVILVVLVGCVAAGGLVGNLLVVVVMAAGGHRCQESNILRSSLAVADLLTTVFAVCPALYRHLQPFITANLPFQESIDADILIDVNITVLGLVPLYSGHHVVQGLLFSTSTLVSVLTLGLLSFERLVLTTEALPYTKIFSVPRVLFLIAFAWIDAILGAIIFSYKPEGFVATYSSMTKLVVGMSTFHDPSIAYLIFYYIHLALIAVIVIATIILSIIAIRNFLVEEARVTAEWKNLEMRVFGPRKRENRYIVISQLLMTLLFLLTLLPFTCIFLLTFADADVYLREYFAILEYISWWLFLGGSAWNPWIYNIRSQPFREDALAVLRSLMPRHTRSPDEHSPSN